MWETIKNAIIGVKDAIGIEIPGLPADLGSIGESATAAAQTATESATGAIEGATAATDAVAGSVAGVTETVSGIPAAALDSAAQALPAITEVPLGGSATKWPQDQETLRRVGPRVSGPVDGHPAVCAVVRARSGALPALC